MYIDGRLIASKQVPGELTNWDPEFHLALANELTGDRAWLGEYYGVAIWDSACSAEEAAKRFQAGSRAKPADQPLVHYTFAESRGDTVRDVSGRDEPLNLTIEKPSAVRWLPGGGLRIDSSTRIASAAPAGKISQAVRRSGELTVEAWVRPANTTQAGPARIVTCSADPSRRNFTLGQAAGDFEMRFRTSTTTPTANHRCGPRPRMRTADPMSRPCGPTTANWPSCTSPAAASDAQLKQTCSKYES
jgi:hypothetical protein